jgi:hypothetical protein
MGFRAVLQWAADIDGKLIGKRCERIARARGYKQGWVWNVTGKRWDQVWEEAVRWRAQQQREQT